MSDQQSGSVMDGIEFEKRRPVDANWSKHKRLFVGICAAVLALGAVGAGGWFAWQNRPVSLPTTAEQALATIKSGRVDRLPADRKSQYYAEASRLLRDVPREEWRDTFDEDDRDALRRVMMERFNESIREIARGESSPQEMMQNMWGRRPPGGREGGENREREREDRDREGEGDGERPSRAERQQERVSRMQDSFQNGDAQRTGLMGEFFTMMRAQREASGQTGTRPGGGNRGG